MNLPTVCYYYRSDNANARQEDWGDKGITLYYSYKTIVAFRYAGKLHVRENIWGPTTGKHLNAIDGGAKESRYKSEEFTRLLHEVLRLTDLEGYKEE
jgi:hypothetical protein